MPADVDPIEALRSELVQFLKAAMLEYLESGQPYASQSGSSVTVSTTSVQVLGYNPLRIFATIVNAGANDVYLSFGSSAVALSGIYLVNGGGALVIGKGTDIPYTGVVSGITAAGTTTLTITEG